MRAYEIVCGPLAVPVKSRPGVWFMGPTYQMAVRSPSKGLPVPLKVPRARARAGRKSAPADHANRPVKLRARSNLMLVPAPVRTATVRPARKHATNWRGIILAHEKSNERVPKRDSREPMADQTITGHNHATASRGPRDALRGEANCAIRSPAATAYHHQRSPCSASRSSAVKM